MTIRNTEQTNSRRRFFQGAVASIAGTALLSPQTVSAQVAATMTDVDVLNYALTLENLEAAFYVEGLKKFTTNDFTRGDFAEQLGTVFVTKFADNLNAVRDHEVAHVALLNTAIKSLGGIPVLPCTYNFGYRNFEEFLQTAAILEEVGVTAYAGALQLLKSSAIATTGASIMTVEARHAAYLALVTDALPFPRSFDVARTMVQVLAESAPFSSNCPLPGTLPPSPTGTMAVISNKNNTSPVRDISLDGSKSIASDGKPLTYSWKSLSGNASLSNSTSAIASAQMFGGYGNYVFELTVTDSTGASAKDQTTILYTGR